MNNPTKIFFFFFTLATLFFSCKKSPSRLIESGSWMVSLYMEGNKDETSDFNGYIFDFNKDGTLVATQPSGAVSLGSWSYDKDANKYRYSIAGTDKLEKLNDSWIIISTSKTLIQLQDDNPTKNEVINFRKR